VVPVDVHRLAYAPFQEEVANALHHFCAGRAEMAARFLDACFAGTDGDAARKAFDRTRGFFIPFYYLRKLHRKAVDPRSTAAANQIEAWRSEALKITPEGGTS
jgi:hypothetical protein